VAHQPIENTQNVQFCFLPCNRTKAGPARTEFFPEVINHTVNSASSSYFYLVIILTSSNIIRIKWARHVARMGKIRNANKTLVEQLMG
jgi:hypothetical protein